LLDLLGHWVKMMLLMSMARVTPGFVQSFCPEERTSSEHTNIFFFLVLLQLRLALRLMRVHLESVWYAFFFF